MIIIHFNISNMSLYEVCNWEGLVPSDREM